jgi:hypothetical protein
MIFNSIIHGIIGFLSYNIGQDFGMVFFSQSNSNKFKSVFCWFFSRLIFTTQLKFRALLFKNFYAFVHLDVGGCCLYHREFSKIGGSILVIYLKWFDKAKSFDLTLGKVFLVNQSNQYNIKTVFCWFFSRLIFTTQLKFRALLFKNFYAFVHLDVGGCCLYHREFSKIGGSILVIYLKWFDVLLKTFCSKIPCSSLLLQH